jgi:hypothetical protein
MERQELGQQRSLAGSWSIAERETDNVDEALE